MRTKHYLTHADVEKAAAACKAIATENGWNMVFAIVDDGGHLLQFTRMDGIPSVAAEMCIMKARTAAISRMPTKMWHEILPMAPGLMGLPGFLPVMGGVPIMHEGECLGAIGASGHQGDGDERCAAAGVEAILKGN